MQHSFDVKIAQLYGVEVAIFLNNLAFWIQKNQANQNHFHDGRYWTHNTVKSYAVLFSYWTIKQTRNVINKCKKYGLLLTANYNSTPYDRKLWYTLSDKAHELLDLPICPFGQMDGAERANLKGHSGKCIKETDSKPDVKQKRGKARKKRVPLPDDFYPNERNLELMRKTEERTGTPRDVLLAKFKAVQKDRGAHSEDWQAKLEHFLLTEKPQQQNSYKKEEVRRPKMRDFTEERLARERGEIH